MPQCSTLSPNSSFMPVALATAFDSTLCPRPMLSRPNSVFSLFLHTTTSPAQHTSEALTFFIVRMVLLLRPHIAVLGSFAAFYLALRVRYLQSRALGEIVVVTGRTGSALGALWWLRGTGLTAPGAGRGGARRQRLAMRWLDLLAERQVGLYCLLPLMCQQVNPWGCSLGEVRGEVTALVRRTGNARHAAKWCLATGLSVYGAGP